MRGKTYYLGLAVTYHDPALAIVDENGAVLFAEATERPLQTKRAINGEPDQFHRLPELLQAYCPDAARFVLAFNWRRLRPWYERYAAAWGLLNAPGLLRRGIQRLGSPLDNYQIHHMMACNRNSIARAGLNLTRFLRQSYPHCAVEFRDFEHHASHAAIACYASPFDEAACAVVDSYGENGSMAFYGFRDGKLLLLHEARGLGSLGLYYMKITELCGFDWMQGEEWKVMGLAPYGRLDEEVFGLLKDILQVRGLALEHPRGRLFPALERLEKKRRLPGEPAERAADLAYTGQFLFSEILVEILANFHAAYPADNLALAGGCALNCAFNGQITALTPFRELYVPPAPADDGTALGAAWLAFHAEHRRRTPQWLSPYLGSSCCERTLQRLVCHSGGLAIQHLPDTVCEETARHLASGKLVGWVQGRAEFGPRALGNRSLLADPRDPGMKDRINQRVKLREEYRPFAPSILHEHGPDYFEQYQPSPYMERALRFRAEAAARVPAVVHVDGTGRLQTVQREWNPRFHGLIKAFYRETGIPLLLNTSFNIMGKPIVHSVEDAIALFMTCGLDILVIGDWLFAKPEAA
ncbi:MAG: carbamoyltransferase C-terminal domain-containing protein [Methylococcaceae bacterium]|nr:carbamoyltransferase C-terminal domain-containing protein [Methylococcaceae bacterium]